MGTASSAARTWSASRSASEKTATVGRPITRQVRATRTAISPRLAIRTLRKGLMPGGRGTRPLEHSLVEAGGGGRVLGSPRVQRAHGQELGWAQRLVRGEGALEGGGGRGLEGQGGDGRRQEREGDQGRGEEDREGAEAHPPP